MKTLQLVFILLLISPFTLAQKVLAWEPKEKNPADMPLDEQGEIRFHELVSLPNLASDNILKRAHRWAKNTYLSADDVILHSKRKLVIRGSIKTKTNVLVGHRLVLEVSRGQYQVTVDSLHYLYDMNSFSMKFPAKVIRAIRLHSYGASADDFYAFYNFLYSYSVAQKADTTQSKRMALIYANAQGSTLAEIKQTIEEGLASLKKNIENEANQ